MAFLMSKEANPNIETFFNKTSRAEEEMSFSPSEISVSLGQLRPSKLRQIANTSTNLVMTVFCSILALSSSFCC